nr:MLO protein homolog 1-like [Ipomoea trifida]
MMEALEKIKAELMLLGFISLLITVSTTLVARICIPPHFAHTWLPCPHDSYNQLRLLLSFNVTGDVLHRRFLAGVDDEKDYCGSRGKTSLISYAGVHQLHIFIFVLAVMHIVYSVVLVLLGQLKILVLTGTKLELVIMEMAQQIQDKTNVVRGAPIVEPTNDFFWFSKPHWILFLIHFSLFENAFQMAYFLWSLMGSHMKTAIFEEQTAKAVKKWQKEAKQRQKKRSPQNTSSSRDSSPSYLLHNLNNSSSAHPPMGY